MFDERGAPVTITMRTGVPRALETAPTGDPTVGLWSCGGPRGGRFLMSEVPL